MIIKLLIFLRELLVKSALTAFGYVFWGKSDVSIVHLPPNRMTVLPVHRMSEQMGSPDERSGADSLCAPADLRD